MFQWLIGAGIVLLALTVLYGAYKLIWYGGVMLRLRIYLGKQRVKFIRPFRKIIFGKKGRLDFELRTKRERFSVAVVSYITNHSRLNIEKMGSDYFINVRRKRIFRDAYYHSAEPEHSVQYRGEMSLSHKPLLLESPKSNSTPILLFYPKPKELTLADRDLKILYGGDKIGEHRVMFWDDFKALK